MKIAGRKLSELFRALFAREHYRAAFNMLRIYENPLDAYRRYLFDKGAYPTNVVVKTPLGKVTLEVFSFHDILTINEVFCRNDYFSSSDDSVFVDFGANIGVSAAYFLTRGSGGFAYLFEPVGQNLEKLKTNLEFVEKQYVVASVAVGPSSGVVGFGIEPTGRYGGIGVHTGAFIEVECVDSNVVLSEILKRHGKIDILKIDIEGLESEVVTRIPKELRVVIRRIYAECRFQNNPFAETHSYRQYGSVAQFTRLQL